jgi:hypothetical protein
MSGPKYIGCCKPQMWLYFFPKNKNKRRDPAFCICILQRSNLRTSWPFFTKLSMNITDSRLLPYRHSVPACNDPVHITPVPRIHSALYLTSSSVSWYLCYQPPYCNLDHWSPSSRFLSPWHYRLVFIGTRFDFLTRYIMKEIRLVNIQRLL